MFALATLFIIYGTTIPWDFDHPPSLARVAWIPLWDSERGRIWSLPDVAQNIVLFLPFGFFGALALPSIRRRRSLPGGALLGLAGFSLSFVVEFLQTMSDERMPSASDLTANTIGAFAGGLAALWYARHLSALVNRLLGEVASARPGMLVFLGYAVALAAGGLAPFIPTLDVGSLRASVRALIDHPWGTKPLGALIPDVPLFAALGVLAALELAPFLAARGWFPKDERGRVSRAGAAALGAVFVALFSGALEVAQIFIIDHGPGLQDAAAASFGGLLGALVVLLAERGPIEPADHLGELSERLPSLVLTFAIFAPLFRALAPFQLVALSEKTAGLTVWNFVPFWAFFQNITLSSFRNVFEAALYYVPIGYALFASHRSATFAAGAACLLAEILEGLQLFVADRTYDVTEGIFASTGALLGVYLLVELRTRAGSMSGPATSRFPPLGA